MTMHWTPPRPAAPRPPPEHPEPGEWVTIIGICGCGRETGRQTVLWPSEVRTVCTVTSCPGSYHCSFLNPSMVLRWTHWGPAVDLKPKWTRAHP